MKRIITKAQLERLAKSGAQVKQRQAKHPRVAEKPERKSIDSQTVENAERAALQASDLVQKAASMVAEGSRHSEQATAMVEALGKRIAAVMEREKRPVPCRLKVNRNEMGFIDSIDVIPIPRKKAAS